MSPDAEDWPLSEGLAVELAALRGEREWLTEQCLKLGIARVVIETHGPAAAIMAEVGRLRHAAQKTLIFEAWLTEQLEDLAWYGDQKTQTDYENGVYDGDSEETEIRLMIDLHKELMGVQEKLSAD